MAERRLAVLGSPISHSKSPALHRAAYDRLGLDWSYEAVEVDGPALPAFLGGLAPDWRGLSLTMPLKQDVLPLVDELDRVARLTGAANTLLLADDGRRLGFNTDVGGIVRAVREAGRSAVARGVLLGAGATAASALAALHELGAAEVTVFARTPGRAAPIVALGARLGVAVRVEPIDALGRAPGADLVVSTVPGGTELPHEASVALRTEATLFDVAYDPWPSRLAVSWLDAGGEVIHGLGMLLHQALLQVRVFVAGDPATPLAGEDEVLAAMRAAVL
ncbi:shikimate dehydrogenase [Agromyces aerolatus]|uniref:shikimate dehydrogenase n=1 Tax=Agromyces sp. LY-1074 TaxID=3074080 RepID=UPI00285A4E3A|nr:MULTISPECIES: shikimate dehydrogenase [unclassified Agromyces]MDR5700618.1 shikimate dehydrogenase [Agromyces sp. LY-1074]MDR5707139.1 shikimate dehydrogenase [Agromyces sp. LY-1358]